MTLTLHYNGSAKVPLEVEGINPDIVRDKSLAEVAAMPVYHGNEPGVLGDFFQLAGDPSDARMEWEGDLRGVHWVGAKMTAGEVIVPGSVGRHLGSEMRGGTIQVQGDAGDWVGGEMKGGLIHVRGRAGHLIGAAYRGSARGMTGGTILIEQEAGNEIGHTMRRGLIAIGGGVGDLVGFNLLAGTILVFGDCGIRHGAGMRRGTIGFFGQIPELLPSFRSACRYRPEILTLIFRQLREWEFPVPAPIREAEIDLYHGDLIEGGRGEIWMRA